MVIVAGRSTRALESISVRERAPHTISGSPSIVSGLVGIVSVVSALVVAVPVAINLPGSWLGAVVCGVLGIFGVVLIARSRRGASAGTQMEEMLSNNSLERTVRHGGPRLAAARPPGPAAQLSR